MAGKFFTTLLQRQIDMFIATFQDDGASLFKNEQNVLIHPGEYGMYRERCFCALLKSVLTRDCSLSDGFIFSSRNHITTQCDILVKNALSMPLTDSGIGKFHPVEDVYAIVEMKSNLSKSELAATLRKMAEVKKIGDDRTTRRKYQETAHLLYEPIPTFLVCNRLLIGRNDALDFNAIYDGIDRKYWHNAILSVEDGLFHYQYKPSDLPARLGSIYSQIASFRADAPIGCQNPQLVFRFQDEILSHDCAPAFLPALHEQKYAHIMRFLSLMTQAVALSEKYQFDSAEYLN